mgnify:CR=1 FL=1
MILLIVLAVLARWKARDESMEGVRRAPVQLMLSTFAVATPALILPFVIRAMVGGGYATATEVSTVAVVYALVIGITIYGGIPLSRLGAMLVDTAAMTGAILLILGTASAMAWVSSSGPVCSRARTACTIQTSVSGVPSALEDTCIPELLRTLTTQRARLTDGTMRGRGNHNLAGLCHFGKAH